MPRCSSRLTHLGTRSSRLTVQAVAPSNRTAASAVTRLQSKSTLQFDRLVSRFRRQPSLV